MYGSGWDVFLGLLLVWGLISLLAPLPFLFIRPPAGPNRFGEVGRPMEFLPAVKAFFSNYFEFSGRASRSEFWWAILFNFVVGLVLSRVEFLNSIWTLCTFFPSISLATRRLHDINRSGWLQLLWFCFPIGMIAMIVWYATPPKDADWLAGDAGPSGPSRLDNPPPV